MQQSNSTLVTIITVCFNASDDLKKTISSVREQSYKNIEFIIIDGKSKDNTIDVIKDNSDIITTWKSEPDKGIYDAMNKGIILATGDWICFMNAGDIFMEPDVIKRIFENEIPDEIDVMYGDVCFDYAPYGKVIKRMDKLSGINKATDLCHQSTFTRSSLIKENLYDLNYRIASDMNTFYKLWKKGVKFMYVPECIACFEALGGISSTRYMTSFKERTKIQGIHWYNSLYWWSYYFRSLAKTIIQKLLPKEVNERYLYHRVRKQNWLQ